MVEWIDVTERLPELIRNEFHYEYRKPCIVADDKGMVFAAHFCDWEDYRGPYWELGNHPCGNNITHWQPLPEHPHPEWQTQYLARLDDSWKRHCEAEGR